MTIYFGENIKRFRTEKSMTQETLASFLGVSFQTVSKWERGETYPDISMLPVISAFFNTTTDDLLGIDKSKKEEKIKEYLEIYDKMRFKNTTYTLEKLSDAVKEFPGDYRLLIRYMETLMFKKGLKPEKYKNFEKISQELMQIYDNIQNYCTDDSIRIWSKRLICAHLDAKFRYTKSAKYKQEVETILNEMPTMVDSREYISTILVSDFEEHQLACSRAIELELCLLENTVIHYCHYKDKFSIDYKIELIEKLFKLYDIFFTDGNYGKLWHDVVGNYAQLGLLYHQKNNDENSLKYFRLAAEHAKKFDALPPVTQRTAQFFEGTNYQKPQLEKTMCEKVKINITKHYPLSDELKASEEFKEIVDILNG